MDEVDPRNAEAFPNALTRGQANDFLFSTGRDIRPYVVDQMYKEKYGKKEGIPNRSQYNVDTKNVKDSKGKLKLPGKKEFTPEIKNRIDSLWNANSSQWNNLSYDDQQSLMGLGRQSYGRAINRGPGEGNENLEQYNEVWHGRIPNLNSANYNNPVWWDQDHKKRYGGNMVSQFPTKQYGGLPTAQEGNLPIDYNIPSYAKYEDLYGNYYDEDYEPIVENEKGYFSVSGNKDVLKNIYKHGTSELPYLASATPKGMNLISKDLIKPIGADVSQAQDINNLRWKKRFSKINPNNVPSNGIEGGLDLLGNIYR
jgi:hypothetical protein